MNICSELASLLSEGITTDYGCMQIADNQYRITTPFLDLWNDNIELDLTLMAEDLVRISDNCRTVDRLWLQGVDVLETKEKLARVEEICNALGFSFEQGEVSIRCQHNELGVALSLLSQTIIRIYGMINSVQPISRHNFPEEVAGTFAVQRLGFDRNVYVQGAVKRSRVNFVFENGSRKLLNALSSKNKKNAETLAELNAFRFDDIRQVHDNVVPLVVYDLRDGVWTPSILNIMNAHDIRTFAYPGQKIELTQAIRSG